MAVTTLAKLRRERAKHPLSTQHQVRVEIKALIDAFDFSEPLIRAQFKDQNDDMLFCKMMEPVKKALADIGMSKGELN
jgi:molecular chaperone DnaK (HSP70)